MEITFKNIAPVLNTESNRISKWISYFGLGIGVLLLLCSLQMFININQALKESNPRKNGFDFISVTKTVTNENMGKDNSFTEAELNEIKKQPEIDDAAALLSNQFRARASAGNIIPFTTDLFLESIENDFIDTVPPGFTWQPGQLEVPIIFSSDFLEIYNVFAPSQDLPQLSDKTVSSVNIFLECSGPKGLQYFKGNIIALSDRLNSVLVPKTFMDWANKNFGGVSKVNPARIFIKTKDANDPRLLSFMQKKGYHINKDKTKFGRIKKVLQNIVGALGVFGVLVILLALMLFSFYLQLMIAKSRDNLQLLLTLGYSPGWLSSAMSKTWIPVYLIVIITAVVLTVVLNFLFVKTSFVEQSNLSAFIHWSVIAVAGVLLFLSIFSNHTLVRRELHKIA